MYYCSRIGSFPSLRRWGAALYSINTRADCGEPEDKVCMLQEQQEYKSRR